MKPADKVLSERSLVASLQNMQVAHAKASGSLKETSDNLSNDLKTKTNNHANNRKAKPVSGYYALEDITILRDALLVKTGYKLNPDDNRLILANGSEMAEDYTIYLPPPLENQTITSLKETICLALMNPKKLKIIFFPYRLENSSHWVTGNIVIKNNFQILFGFHDSANFYVKQAIERQLFDFLNNLDNVKKFLLEPDRAKKIHEGRKTLAEALSKPENKIKMTLLGKSKIAHIQFNDTYCGGYVLRLIVNLAIKKAVGLDKVAIWDCNNQSDQKLREEDAEIVENYNKNKAHLFGSRAEARDYTNALVHREISKTQEEELKKLYQEIEVAIQKLEQPEKVKLLAQLSTVNTQNLRKFKEDIILACGDSGGKISLKSPVAFFFQKTGNAIDSQSRVYDKLPIIPIYRAFMEILRRQTNSRSISVTNTLTSNMASATNKLLSKSVGLKTEVAPSKGYVGSKATNKENVPPSVVKPKTSSNVENTAMELSAQNSKPAIKKNAGLKKGSAPLQASLSSQTAKQESQKSQDERKDKKYTSEKTGSKPVKKAGFVINVPYRVESDDDVNGSSSDEEETHEFNNEKHYFQFTDENPPFRIQTTGGKAPRKLRGIINPKSIIHASDLTKKQAEPKKAIADKLKALITMFETQSFEKDADASAAEATQRLGMVVGLNRRESLEKRRNKNYRKLLKLPLENKMNVERLGFLWRPNYEERGAEDKIWRPVSFERVRNWFRVFRNKYPEKAKKFRETTEKGPGEMVPYRSIRETIKMDPCTAQQVKVLRERTGLDKTRVYLGIFDGDMIVCKDQPSDLGIFSRYDKLISRHERQHKKIPTILSTGYKINEPNKPILEFAVDLDAAIRAATAEFFGGGIYYPEPNMLLLVEPNENTMTESFVKANKVDYESPVESKIMIENITKRRTLNQYSDFCFRNRGPVTTTTPERFAMLKLSKSKKDKVEAEGDREKLFKQFSGNINRKGKITLWTRQDLDYIRNTPQSHFDNLQWAKNIVAVIHIPDKILPNAKSFPKEKIEGHQLKLMIISLVSQLFNCYDPLYISKNLNIQGKECFVERLSYVINNYNKENFVPKAIPKREDKERKNCAQTWKLVDDAVTVKDLSVLLAILLNDKNLAERIVKAVRKCGQTIQEQFKSRLNLNFVEYTKNALDAYMQEVTDVDELSEKMIGKSSEFNEKVMKLELNGFQNLLNKRDVLAFQRKLKKNANLQARWGLTPLHCAAITGNVQLVKALIENGARIDIQAMGNVLPLHLALKFCELQGINEELIELLTDNNIVNCRTLDNQSPLWMAINLPFENEVDEDMLAVTECLLDNGANPNEDALSNSAQNDHDNNNDNSDDEGATLNDIARRDKMIFSDKRKGNFPIFVAIASGNSELLNLLIDYGAKLTNVYNENGLNPILAASNNLEMVKWLVESGADVNEMDYENSTTVLHESINPSTIIGVLKAPNKSLFKYLLSLENIELTTTDLENYTPFDIALDERCGWAVRGLLKKAKGLACLDTELHKLKYPVWYKSAEFASELSNLDSTQDEVCSILAPLLVDRDTFEACETQIIRNLTGYKLYCEEEQKEIMQEQRSDYIDEVMQDLCLKKPRDEEAFREQVDAVNIEIVATIKYDELRDLINDYWDCHSDSEGEDDDTDSEASDLSSTMSDEETNVALSAELSEDDAAELVVQKPIESDTEKDADCGSAPSLGDETDGSDPNGKRFNDENDLVEEYGEAGLYRKRKRKPMPAEVVAEMDKEGRLAEPVRRLKR